MTNMATCLAALATVTILAVYQVALAFGRRRKPEGLARTAHAALREEWFAAVSAQKGSEILAVLRRRKLPVGPSWRVDESVSRTQARACDAVLKMGVGLPKPACRSRLQTARCCCVQKAWW